jgi:hypothetical protein
MDVEIPTVNVVSVKVFICILRDPVPLCALSVAWVMVYLVPPNESFFKYHPGKLSVAAINVSKPALGTVAIPL